MIRFLQDGALDETAGRSADLASLVEQYRLAGSTVSLENSLHDGGDLLPLQLQTTIYRVAAESLRNAYRHSPGTPITVALYLAKEFDTSPEIVLVVSNPLCLLPSESLSHEQRDGTGTGIPSMHFRAAHSSGTLTVGSHSGQWVVELRLPVSAGPHLSPELQRKGATA